MYSQYNNFHHDPSPLIFILYSDTMKTHALNIHYLIPAHRFAFFNMLRNLINAQNKTGIHMYYDGKMIYEMLKRSMPIINKFSYRTYFSAYLNGISISEGLNAVNPLLDLYTKVMNLQANATNNFMLNKAKADPMVREINKIFWDKRTKEMQQATVSTYRPPATPQPNQVRPTQVTPQQLRQIYAQRAQQQAQQTQPGQSPAPTDGTQGAGEATPTP